MIGAPPKSTSASKPSTGSRRALLPPVVSWSGRLWLRRFGSALRIGGRKSRMSTGTLPAIPRHIGDPVISGGDSATADVLGLVGWDQPHGRLGQLGGDLRGAAGPCPAAD